MRIGRRLELSYSLMAGLVLLLVIGASVLTGRVNQEFRELNIQTTKLIPALEDLRFRASEVTAELTEHLLFSALHERLPAGGGEEAHEHQLLEVAEVELRHFHEDIKMYEAALGRYAVVVAEFFPGEGSIAKALRETGNGLIKRSRDLLRISAASPTEEELTEIIGEFERAETIFFKNIDVALAHEQNKAYEREEKVDVAVTTATASAWVGLLLACTFIFVYGALITRSITRPLGKLTEATARIGRGEFGTAVDVHGKDETGVLARAFEQMSQDLSSNIAALEVAQNDLKNLNEALEQRVVERTSELRTAQDELLCRERLATLGQLTATVSHELRNPLGVIQTSTFVVRDNLKNCHPRVVRSLERIERSVIRCDRIIDEILDYTRIRKLEPEPTPIDTWLDAVLKEQTLRSDITLRRDPGLPGVNVFLDHDRFRRAVINVFDNACQAMAGDGNGEIKDGEHTLTIQTGKTNGRIEVVFEDNGPGIPPDVLPKIFEPMFSTKGFGVGLGLPVVKQIMEQHGGGVEIDSVQGRGTRTCLWLPFDYTIH